MDQEISAYKEQTLEREMLELHRKALETALEVQNNAMLYVKYCIFQAIKKKQGEQK